MTHPPSALGRHDVRVMLVLAAVSLALGAVTAEYGLAGVYHDDGVYALTAQSLAHGDSYRMISLPGAPFQTKYPPLYPLLLAPFSWSIPLMQVVTQIAAAAGVALSWGWLVARGHATRPVATVACLLAAASPVFVFHAGILLSESLFIPLLVLALWRIETDMDLQAPSWQRTLGAGALLALPALCRTVGVAVPLAVGLGWVAFRDRRRLPLTLAGAALVFGPWLLWTSAVPEVADPPPHLVYYLDYGGWLSNAGGMQGTIMAWNGLSVAYLVGMFAAEGWATVLFEGVGGLLALALVGLTPVWWLIHRVDRHSVLPWALAAYMAIVVAWPWPPVRFLLPVLPLLLTGVVWAGSRVLSRWPWLAVGLASALFAAAVGQTAWMGTRTHALEYPAYPHVPDAELAHWDRYAALLGWIEANTAPDAVIASGFDPMVYLYTGRLAYRPFVGRPVDLYYGAGGPALGTVDQLRAAILEGGATHVAKVAMPLFAEEAYLAEMIDVLEAEGTLRPVYTDASDERFAVYAVIRGTRAPGSPPPPE